MDTGDVKLPIGYGLAGGRVGLGLAQGGGTVAVPGWWVVAGKTCLVAFAPKGAASLAASYSNLANPGTYDAAPGVAPTFNAATGWTFNGSSQYLLFGAVSVTQACTVLIRLTQTNPTGTRYLTGTRGAAGIMLVAPKEGTNRSCYNMGYKAVAGELNGTYNFGFAGKTIYLNGNSDGTIGAGTGTINNSWAIGCWWNTNTPSDYFAGNVAAYALYSDTLTSGQVATVAAAMAAL